MPNFASLHLKGRKTDVELEKAKWELMIYSMVDNFPLAFWPNMGDIPPSLQALNFGALFGRRPFAVMMYEGKNPLPLDVRRKYHIQQVPCSDSEAIEYVNDRAWNVDRLKYVEDWQLEPDWFLRGLKRELRYTDPSNPIYNTLKADIEKYERERDERRKAERRAREEERRHTFL